MITIRNYFLLIISVLFISFNALAKDDVEMKKVSAQEYADTITQFKGIKATKPFFNDAYGFAIFPTIGKGGIGIGGAYGEGRVYRGQTHVGDTTMAQVSIGLQLGGQAFSEVIFFEDEKAYTSFTSGNFEFGAQASAIAVTAGANASAGTTGVNSGAGKNNKGTKYVSGMVIFVMEKGGLMYEAALQGQKFTFEGNEYYD
ncbi:YSC84-related protein [Vibrio sp.]|nr:YSC84-related protein [Vibrio sp.]